MRRAAVASAAAATVTLAIACTSASPQDQIVLQGAAPGSHLTLTVRGDHLIAKGWMAPARPAGCHFTRPRMVAVCPLDGVGSIELNMGPGGDMVEVLDPLPVPITAYLGSGSDKLIGNGEADTCYPQGNRRNRCVGGPGSDICITGDRNSDCVGGGGDDYCQTGSGSDGCWGGPGDDVCRMGSGHDGCHGEDGNDRLYGGPSSDQLYGGAGFDYCDGEEGWGRSQECEAGPRR